MTQSDVGGCRGLQLLQSAPRVLRLTIKQQQPHPPHRSIQRLCSLLSAPSTSSSSVTVEVACVAMMAAPGWRVCETRLLAGQRSRVWPNTHAHIHIHTQGRRTYSQQHARKHAYKRMHVHACPYTWRSHRTCTCTHTQPTNTRTHMRALQQRTWVWKLAPALEAVPEVVEGRHIIPARVRLAHVGHGRVHRPARVAAERGRKHLLGGGAQ